MHGFPLSIFYDVGFGNKYTYTYIVTQKYDHSHSFFQSIHVFKTFIYKQKFIYEVNV
jgi:hypothetical protein